MVERALLLKIGAVVVGIGVLVVGGVAAFALTGGFTAPSLESIETQWGNVTDEHATIETTAVVENPNPVGVPGVVTIEYQAQLNDVVLANGSKSGIGLSTGTNEIALKAEVEHETIAQWWVTHVNNDEQSELAISQSIEVFGFEQDLPARTQEFNTDLIGSLTTEGAQDLTLAGREMLTIKNQSATWGEADIQTTPLVFEATLVNNHDHPIELAGFGYNVTMNDVLIGQGETSEGLTVEPGSSSPMEITAAIDTPKMADWWETHLRNDEQSRLEITFYALVEDDGETVELPLAAMSKAVSLETDMLGGGGAQVSPVESGGQAPEFRQPTVGEPDSQWGEVTDSVSPIETDVPVSNPNDEGPLNSLLSVTLDQSTSINGIEVAAGSTTVASIPPGNSTVSMTSEMDNSLVPEWWSAHINNGEHSTVETVQSGTVDLGFTKFTLDEERRTNTIETSTLDPLNTTEDRAIHSPSSNQKLLVVKQTTAEWGQSTPQEAPIEVTAVFHNDQAVPVTIDSISYVMRMNSVKVADDEAVLGTTIQPGETKTVTFTIMVDNQKMDEWWVTHVNNNEVTTTKFSIVATMTAGGETEEVPFGFLSDDQQIETDVLGNKGSSDVTTREMTAQLAA